MPHHQELKHTAFSSVTRFFAFGRQSDADPQRPYYGQSLALPGASIVTEWKVGIHNNMSAYTTQRSLKVFSSHQKGSQRDSDSIK